MGFIRDLQQTLRTLARHQGFSLSVILTLALGLGAAVGLLSVARSVLLQPLAYRDPERLVAVFAAEDASDRSPISPADFADLAAASETVRDMAAAHPWSATLTGFEAAERIPGLRATANLFDLLGVPAARGRTFLAEEGTPGRDRVVVLSWDLWQRRFGGDPDWVGRELMLNGEPYEVVGVMPRGFGFPPFWAADAELWVPLALDADTLAQRNARFLRAFGRLTPGHDLAAARREMDALADRLAVEHPQQDEDLALRVDELREPVVGQARPALLALLAGGGLLYLIAASNVAGLFTARRVQRESEMAVRAALGASRGRLLRPWLLEALLLGLGGAVVGVVAAEWGVELLVRFAPADLPRRGEIAVDASALAVAVVLALLPVLAAAALAGLVGRRRGTLRMDDARTLGGARARLRSSLVVAQVALATALLLGAGLTAAALSDLVATDPGFRRHGLLTANLSLTASRQGEPENQVAFFDAVRDELASLPGVEAVALVNHVPVAGDTWGLELTWDGEEQTLRGIQRVVSDDYFRALGATLLAGRAFDPQDRADTPPVVVINASLARRLAGDPAVAVGRQLRLFSDGSETARVVGVVADTTQSSLAVRPDPEVFFPYAQNPTPWFRQTSVVLRVDGDPAALAEPLRKRLAALAPDVPVFDLRSMDQVLAADVAGPRWTTLLLAGFAAAALALSAVGLYGVLSFLVSSRRRELGLRLVLGASRRRLLAAVVGQGLVRAAAGLVLGLLAGAAAVGWLASQVPGFSTGRPQVYVVLAALVLASAALASFLPAARTLGQDPARSLRDGT